MDAPGGRLESQILEPIKIVSDIKPVSIIEISQNSTGYDFGQNFAGWVRISVCGPEGTAVNMKFSELQYDDGTVNCENLRSAKAEDVYILKGRDIEIYEPRFTYHGFRFMQMECTSPEIDIIDVTGRVVRSAVENSGFFECDNELINRIHKAARWTEANNLHSVSTDCPQRDERLGWLNDLTVRTEESVYNFDMARFYTKYARDIADTQSETTGAITDTAPFVRLGRRPADPVCSSFLIVPWYVYLFYNDIDVLKEHFSGMQRWVDYLRKHTEDNLVYYTSYGDWASPAIHSISTSLGAGALSAITPGEFISSGYYYMNVCLLEKIAGIIGRNDAADEYRLLAQKIRQSFNDKYFDKKSCNYATGSQASNTFALYLGLVPDECKSKVINNLLDDIEDKGYHFSTGNLCTRYLLDVLAVNGNVDAAFKLMTQKTYPSFGYMIENGATTIWERWEYVTTGECEMASHNHPMYASVDAWFYKILAGIDTDVMNPGFSEFIIKPYIPIELNNVNCKLQTVKGEIESSWKKENSLFSMFVKIPFSSRAKLHIPLNVIQSYKEKININEHCKITINEDIVWNNGQCIKTDEAVTYITATDDRIAFNIGSGEYIISVQAERGTTI